MNHIEMTKICDSCLIEHDDTLCRDRIEHNKCLLPKESYFGSTCTKLAFEEVRDDKDENKE